MIGFYVLFYQIWKINFYLLIFTTFLHVYNNNTEIVKFFVLFIEV